MLSDIISFEDVPGWAEDDHLKAFRAFEKSADHMRLKAHRTRELGVSGEALKDIANWLYHMDEGVLDHEARTFFETFFVPRKVLPNANGSSGRGFVTGYFEPEVRGSLTRSDRFQTPLLRRPPDLVEISELTEDIEIPKDWDHELRFARLSGSTIKPYDDRAAIMEGVLDGRGLELVFLEDPVDAFFIHIQGSARIRFENDAVMRVSYDGKTGHPYTPVGRVLIDEGEIAREAMSLAAIRDWFNENPDRQIDIMAHNQSFIFFREMTELSVEDGPLAAAGVSLTTGRSLAVDRTLHTFGTPIYLKADLDYSFQRLMIAQDTGSAIVGPARGDIFFGSGSAAEAAAGGIQHPADFYLLWPKHQPI